MVSHELRTPLYAITALSGILLEGFFAGADAEEDAERAEAHELVQVIKQSSDVLVQIVNNILDFSKYENSSLVLENRPFNVRDAVDLALEIVSAAQTKDGPHINAFVFDDPSTRMVVGDVTRFNQIVTNLTQNGAKFTAEGDVVLVVVTSIDPSGPDVVVVEGFVRDTGVGVAQEHSDKLFR